MLGVVAPWRWLLALCLRLLFLVPAGVPVRSGDAGFPKAMDNVTVRQGDSAILRCAVDNRVTRVAWLNRSTILYTGNDKWTSNPRVVLVANTKSQYSIEIQNVDNYDQGHYTCSVQTDNHPRTSRLHLIVQVPPQILNISTNISVNEGSSVTLRYVATGRLEPAVKWKHYTGKFLPQILNNSTNITVNEGSSVTLRCVATGRPEPAITWKHYTGKSFRFMSDDEYLEITGISREQSGDYECSAANEVAAAAVRRVTVTVYYPPYISDTRNTGAPVGQKGALRCSALAVPMADFHWYKEDTRLSNGLHGVRIENKDHMSILTFFNVSEKDYGNYTCMASNKLGNSNASVILYGPGDLQNWSSSSSSSLATTCLWCSVLYSLTAF